MLIDILLASGLIFLFFLFYVVSKLCLAVLELRRRLDANGIYE